MYTYCGYLTRDVSDPPILWQGEKWAACLGKDNFKDNGPKVYQMKRFELELGMTPKGQKDYAWSNFLWVVLRVELGKIRPVYKPGSSESSWKQEPKLRSGGRKKLNRIKARRTNEGGGSSPISQEQPGASHLPSLALIFPTFLIIFIT